MLLSSPRILMNCIRELDLRTYWNFMAVCLERDVLNARKLNQIMIVQYVRLFEERGKRVQLINILSFAKFCVV